MSAAHLHLMLNHLPVVGTFFTLALLGFGLWRRSDEIKKTALGFFVIVALLAVPVYLTGEPAEDLVKPLPGVSEPAIEEHEEAAAIAFGGAIALGVLALGGLVWFRRGKTVPAGFCWFMLAGSLAVSGLMGWTANLGGQVRHPEIRPDAATAGRTSAENDND